MAEILELMNRLVWGLPALIMILGVGIYLSIRSGFAQLTFFPKSICLLIKQFKKKGSVEGASAYQALCTALAATVGTGNIAGVAGAICIGGPGAVFWMWICALLGMVTKFAEATLSVRFRNINRAGEFVGGPMYMIENGLGSKWKWLAKLYCFLCVFASLGVGNATQINTVIGALNSVITSNGGESSFAVNFLLGIAFASLMGTLFWGGASRIGKIAEKLVPLASAVYILLGVVILIVRCNTLPSVIHSIFIGAFSPKSVTGGVLGSAFIALRTGASRGVFTNEAGMGTASIAHGAAAVNHPVEQGMMGALEVFLDTIVICTITALVILSSGISIPYGQDIGITLTSQAFASVYGSWVHIIMTLAVCCFAVATILGWGLYGARCAQYLFGEDFWHKFVFVQVITIVVGSVAGTGTVWVLSEIVNGLMVIPNLLVLLLLSPEFINLIKEYRKNFR